MLPTRSNNSDVQMKAILKPNNTFMKCDWGDVMYYKKFHFHK